VASAGLPYVPAASSRAHDCAEVQLRDHGEVSELAPEPVDAPSGDSFVVGVYRAGTLDRFPSTRHTVANPGGLLLAPLSLLGWLLHLTVFRRRWTVAVTPWHNLPGPRHREQCASESEATQRAAALTKAILVGEWTPGARSAAR
jgi:hypothetical protein